MPRLTSAPDATLFFSIGYSIVTGFIARAIGRPKNINGFWWGFFLGLIGVLIVALMQSNNNVVVTSTIENNISSNENASKVEQIFPNVENLEKRLKLLKEMKENGIITEEEYADQRKKILKEL